MPTDEKKYYVAIRLSAMGDVALSVPAVQAVCTQNENFHLLLIAKKPFQQFFKDIPNLSFITPDIYGKHKGPIGLFKLFKEITNQYAISGYVDLHDVIRSRILGTYFKIFSKARTNKIDKGRAEKKSLTQRDNKVLQPLTHSTERYATAFKKAGLSCNPNTFQPIHFEATQSVLDFIPNGNCVGIAPFAQHQGKAYPLLQMEEVIHFLKERNVQVIIFGGGAQEKRHATEWEQKYSHVKSAIGLFRFPEELALMQKMSYMLTMDSGNMHLARIVGTDVYSIWGATHPYAGFTPFNQPDESMLIQQSAQTLNCRPCSVFGNKPCFRGDWACMTQLPPQQILEKLPN